MRTTTSTPTLIQAATAPAPVKAPGRCDLSDHQINAVWERCDGDMHTFVQSILDLGIQIGSGAHSIG